MTDKSREGRDYCACAYAERDCGDDEYGARVIAANNAIHHEERPKSRDGIGWLNKLLALAFGGKKNRIRLGK